MKAAASSLPFPGATALVAAALAGLALSAPAAARPDEEGKEEASAEEQERAPKQVVLSADATRVFGWVAGSGDNGELPYMIIDKNAATVFLFDAQGNVLSAAPALIGVTVGDEATPGVGSKSLAKIGPAERTTPAGRFLAKYGRSVGRQEVLWIEYATSVALHAVITGNKKERRRERLKSPTPEDNRITYGCINVPTEFYEEEVQPLFEEEGGMVYVLPDSKPLDEVFPRLRVQPFLMNGIPLRS